MVESASNLFLETIRDLLVEETKFLLSVSSDVEHVKRDLRRMHAMLVKADSESHESPTLELSMDQLRDLALQEEATLEKYAVKVESMKLAQNLKQKLRRYICIVSECYSVHHIGRDAQQIISGLADLTHNLELEFGQERSSHAAYKKQFRQTFAHEVLHHFVGMKTDIQNLVSMVKDETRRQRVVKIYGMGGLGKTTLARKVYNYTDFQSYARAWVCITQHFQPEAVLGNILNQLDSNARTESMDASKLVERIHKFLELQRKSLIVIDDIWENADWEIMKPAFPMNCNVLLTTRYEIIATPESKPYKLELLSEDDGWKLLQEIALPQNFRHAAMKSLEAIGREIVKKCGRLPLAISVMGGILSRKEEHNSKIWKMVNKKMDTYLTHGEGVAENTRVKQVLDLSYDGLPYYLKPCFLYLACFNEDEDIKTEKLYRMWMAEGFISHQDKGPDETLRDVAERYLTELAMRCMVQVRKVHDNYRPNHKFDSCRLHDLMHDLCSLKATKVSHLQRIDPPRYHNGSPPSIGDSTSRLAITFDWNVELSSMKGLRDLKLRSFMVLKENERILTSILFKDSTISFDKSQSLRILMLDGCEFKGCKLPSKVAKLIHLRYLSLVGSEVKKLPKFVCSMPFLQTLDLRVKSIFNVIKVPNVIWKMERLRHLSLPRRMKVIGGEKLKLEGLKLETLHGMKSGTARVADIPH